MKSRFNDTDLDLTEDEKTWLVEVQKKEDESNGAFSPDELLIDLNDQLSKDFRPSQIDERLYKQGRGNDLPGLTLAGSWLVDSDSRQVQLAEQVILTIKKSIRENYDDNTFTADDIAKSLAGEFDISASEVGVILGKLNDIGSFWKGARSWEDSNRTGFKAITVEGESVIRQYLGFEDLDSHITNRIERWMDSSRGLTTRTSSRDIGYSPTKDRIDSGMEPLDIFISHSSEDRDAAEALIDLLESALIFPQTGRIRCTSVDGYRLPTGSETGDTIRQEVSDSKVLIALITPNSMTSVYVLFELGARWHSQKPLYPLTSKGAGVTSLDGPLREINAMDGNEEGQVQKFLEDISSELGLKLNKRSRYGRYIDRLIKLGSS
jgi:hypothetical protein